MRIKSWNKSNFKVRLINQKNSISLIRMKILSCIMLWDILIVIKTLHLKLLFFYWKMELILVLKIKMGSHVFIKLFTSHKIMLSSLLWNIINNRKKNKNNKVTLNIYFRIKIIKFLILIMMGENSCSRHSILQSTKITSIFYWNW